MRIAYLVNQYPMVSHSFIRREILALERQGFEIMRISIRGWDKDLVDPEDLRERERTLFVLRRGILPLLGAFARLLVTRPLAALHGLALALRMSFHAERPLPFLLAYLVEASQILSWLGKNGIKHMHAHFSTNAAEVAMLVNALGGPSWSFTAHGMATLESPRLIGLEEKIKTCS